MAIEYRGDEFIYLVGIEDEAGAVTDHRPFNQTSGSTSESSDEIELSTKDKTGSDYGDFTKTVSLEGIITEGDPAIKFIRSQQRRKRMIRITELNTRTLETETGYYMISTFDREFSNGDFATYSLEAALNGELTEGTLTEVPEGAPASDNETPSAPNTGA
ncbi:phage major tail protein, TP901-1 family [Terribacillus saccharophilus]|uniref:phage major tail protein, TP901-1 family n=1 Tax=Terribacillus saccharophilus TaxID=361277 RepID=UPI003D26BB9E